MKDITVPPADPPKESQKPFSRTRLKRLHNLQLATVSSLGRGVDLDAKERELKETQKASWELRESLAEARAKLNTALAVLEGVVVRHGPQVFDRKEIERFVHRSRLDWEITTNRIAFGLRDEPQLVESVVEPNDVA